MVDFEEAEVAAEVEMGIKAHAVEIGTVLRKSHC